MHVRLDQWRVPRSPWVQNENHERFDDENVSQQRYAQTQQTLSNKLLRTTPFEGEMSKESREEKQQSHEKRLKMSFPK
jgi:hypothetical protein